VAEQLAGELPRIRGFCTLSPVPGFAAWLLAEPDLGTLPKLRQPALKSLEAARRQLRERCGGDLSALQRAVAHEALDPRAEAALAQLCAAYLLLHSPTPGGDQVARFHLDNGARLERINAGANRSVHGLKQSFGVMVNYLYDLDKVEAHREMFVQGETARSRPVQALLQAQFTTTTKETP
jgi:malonyl-CoA decarboxylase